MTKEKNSSQQLFFSVIRHYSHSNFGSQSNTTIDLSWDESERAKGLHDLHAAANAFKAMIELDEAKVSNPDERQIRKYMQLRIHAQKLQDLVKCVEGMLGERQGQE